MASTRLRKIRKKQKGIGSLGIVFSHGFVGIKRFIVPNVQDSLFGELHPESVSNL